MCSPIAGQILVCNDSLRPDAAGSASPTIWLINGDHISQATTKLNDTYYQHGRNTYTPAWREFVACQEIGHTSASATRTTNFTNTNIGHAAWIIPTTRSAGSSADSTTVRATTDPNAH